MGWRRAAKALRRSAWRVNKKRVQSLWRHKGLKIPSRKRRKPLRGIGVRVGPLSPIVPNALWALDFQFDTTEGNRTLKLLDVVDEFTRECSAIVAERSIDADLVVAIMDRLVVERRRSGLRAFRQRSRVHCPTPPTTGRCAASTASVRSSSTPVRPGRTPGPNRSTAGSETSCSTRSAWRACSKRRCSSKTGGLTTNMNRPHSAHGDLTPSEFAQRLDQQTPTSARIGTGAYMSAR
jgi:putative transposase